MKINVHIVDGSIFPVQTHTSVAVNDYGEADYILKLFTEDKLYTQIRQ